MDYRHIHFGPFTVDVQEKRLSRNGKEVFQPGGKPLMPRAVDILIRIIEQPGQIVRSCDVKDLLDQPSDEDRRHEALKKYVSLLRRSMGTEEFQKHVHTVSKKRDSGGNRGYRFVGEVRFAPDETRRPYHLKAPRDAGTRDQHTPVAPIHELPPAHGDFAGRVNELQELLAAEKRGSRIVGLQGPPGVGKTALALKIAEMLSPQYPDAQCYFDLKGMSAQPFSAADAMRHVIWGFRPDAILPKTDMELSGLYRSMLYGKRAVLLIDNARDVAHVLPLLPPSSCILLFTSRLHFTLPGLFGKDLTVLSPSEARDLLLAITPRLEFEADVIALLCGYLPLALRAAGTVLAERIDLDPKEYVHTLQDTRRRLELTHPTENLSIEASLCLSYDLLSSELQQRFRTLAFFTGTFDVAGAAAVWAVDVVDARETLSSLVRYSMLQFNTTTTRYSLHDLLRLFADARLGADEREGTSLVQCPEKPTRILLVDDEPSMQEYYASIFASSGFEVAMETNGDDAFAHYLERGPYDLVLTDYIHPGMAGIDLAVTIRRKNPRQAIAFVTAAASSVEALPPVIKDIPLLEKPFRIQELLGLVKFTIEAARRKPATKP